MRKCLLVLAALAAGLAHAETHVVRIENMQFAPATLVVHRGDTVRWQNHDFVPHTATAAGHFDSKTILPEKTSTRVMATPGRYDYVCTFHPTMKGTIVVE
jgi:plastocyanin